MRLTWLVSGCILLALPLAAQQINPASQIRWPAVTGSGNPNTIGVSCTAVNFGMPFTDISANISYVCTPSGFVASSGSGGGVTTINGIAGAFNFIGTGVSCSTNTCTFVGGSGGGVGPGGPGAMAIYNSTSTVISDVFLLDTAPGNSGNGLLSYSGKQGAQFLSGFGGSYNFTTNNNGGTPVSAAASQISLTTALNTLSTPQTGAGNIVLSAADSLGNNGAANVNISASTPPGIEATASNSGNINLSATGFFPQGSGFINLIADGISVQDNGAGVSITTNSGQTGTPISLVNNAPGGSIQLNASGTNDAVIINAPNFSVSGAGDLSFLHNLTMPFLEASSGTACLQISSTGAVTNTGAACGSGGGGGGIGGSGTVGFIPLYVTNTTTLGNSPLSVTSGIVTSTDPVAVNDGSGTGGTFNATQATAPSGVTGNDLLWADSTAGRFKMNNNNAGALIVPGIASAGTSGDCTKLASNGIDLVDSGAPCLTTGASFTPTLTADAGAGTGGSLVTTLVSGSNDNGGWINLTTGASPAGSNSGVITVNFGGTYTAVRKCLVVPASNLAMQLGTNGVFVPSGTATNTHFVITGGATALAANTTGYAFFYQCVN
jgi:hypothetical protein